MLNISNLTKEDYTFKKKNFLKYFLRARFLHTTNYLRLLLSNIDEKFLFW